MRTDETVGEYETRAEKKLKEKWYQEEVIQGETILEERT